VKHHLARFTVTALVLASMALTLGAGIRWGFVMQVVTDFLD
jgi:hypothetical protein